MPAQHPSWDPVALVVRVGHPTEPLPIVCACLDYGVPYTDDRIAQAQLLADLGTQPRFDGPCLVVVMGDMPAGVRNVQVDISAVTTADRAGRAALRNAHRLLADAGLTLIRADVDIPSWASTTELPSA